MANENTFLSRVFGMNSSYPVNSPLFTNDHDTELSLYNNNDIHSEEEYFHKSEDEEDDEDDEEGELIPESLMVENYDQGLLANAKEIAAKTINKLSSHDPILPISMPQLHHKQQLKRQEKLLRNKLGILTPLERSLWLWANISNLDIFLNDVYEYYNGKGFQCIVIENLCDVLILVFILWLTVFMGNCLDYHKLLNTNPTKLSEVTVPKCYSHIPLSQKFVIFIISVFIILRIKSFILKEVPKLKEIKNFYNYLLNITDDELQTISWNSIVKKTMVLRDQNTSLMISENFGIVNNDLNSKKRLNPHDIANRIMRKENYMIAMFNKNILNLSIPFITSKNHGFLTKTLEWNLNLCIFDFVFDSKTGQLHKKFLKEQNRLQLAKELKNRFILLGILNILLSPFVVSYFILYYFLKFFYEFKANPNLINNREYTPMAMWKFREFNELQHLFKKRLSLSDALASNYINQFPKRKLDLILKFLSFISGSLLTILVILTVLDPESFLNFEITNKKSVLFYISTLGAIYTICQNSIHDDNIVFEPEQNLQRLYKYTHYMPKEWEGKLHTENVKYEFAKFYNLKIIIILKELMSLIFLPIILFYSLPKSTTKIIDFFREFTIHIDELGYVCYFAMFNFDKKDKLRTDYYQSNDDKMMKSYLYFIDNINNDENLDHIESSTIFLDPSQQHQQQQQQQQQQQMQQKQQRGAKKRSNLRNSYIMEESFENSKMRENVPAVIDEDEEDEDDGGVLKFVNQFYRNT